MNKKSLKRKGIAAISALALFLSGVTAAESFNSEFFNNEETVSADNTFLLNFDGSSYYDEQGLEYTLNDDGTAYIVGSSKLKETVQQVTFPSVVYYQGEEYSITKLGNGSNQLFDDNKAVVTIQFEKNSKISELASKCFYNSKITSIVIPESVERIAYDCFYNSSLQEVILPENDGIVMEYGALSYCKLLREITIPSSVKIIPSQCFQGDVSLEKVKIIMNENGYGVTEIKTYAFADCKKLTYFHIPSCVTKINSNIFGTGDVCDKIKDNVKIYGKKDSAARMFAYNFIEMADNDTMFEIIYKGDMDGDGDLTSNDALELLQYVVGLK